MLTVREAAKRAGRNPETIRRWIREGRLQARKVGTQHVLDEADLAEAMAERRAGMPVPDSWTTTFWGGPMPDWTKIVRDPDARTVTEVLDGIPGAFERAERGSAEAAAGLGAPLEDP